MNFALNKTTSFRFTPRVLSTLIGVLLLLCVLFLLWLSDVIKQTTSPDVMVRSISTVALPPPPPPPPRPKKISQPTALSVQVEGQGAAIQTIDIPPPPFDKLPPPEMDINPIDTQWQSLEVDWQVLDLNALDDLPTLLTPIRVVFPKSLTRRGVKEALVKLDVMIDESGQVSLKAITSNPYPELDAELRKLIRGSRFTPPKKDNDPVRARFIWPIKIKA